MIEVEETDSPTTSARVHQFDRDSGEVVEGYRDNLDAEHCGALSESLAAYLKRFSEENQILVEIEVSENQINVSRDDGTQMYISVFGPQIFEITIWPNPEDTGEHGRLVFDLAPELESGVAVSLARQYVMNGKIDNA